MRALLFTAALLVLATHACALHNATQYVPFAEQEIWGTLFENNMLYFVGFTESVTLLKVDPNTLTVVGKAAPMSPQLANVNTMFISEATAYNKLVVTVVWTDDSSNGGTTFSIYSLDTLDPVCSQSFPSAIQSPISAIGFTADNSFWFLDPATVFTTRDSFYSLNLDSCAISGNNVSISPAGFHFDQAFLDPTGDDTRVLMLVDEGEWPNSVPFLVVLTAVAESGGSLQVKQSERVQLSTIGISNFFDGTDYWILSLDQANNLLQYDTQLNLKKNVTLSIPGQQLPVIMAPESQNAIFVASADRANGPGQLLQFNTDTSLSTYQSYSNAAELFAGTKYVFAVGQNAVTRFTVQ